MSEIREKWRFRKFFLKLKLKELDFRFEVGSTEIFFELENSRKLKKNFRNCKFSELFEILNFRRKIEIPEV